MRDGFGIPRDQVIIKAKKEPERTSALPSATLAAGGATAGAAGAVMHQEKRDVAAFHEKTSRDAFKSGKKGLRGVYRKQNAALKDLDEVRNEKLKTAGKNGTLRRLVNQAHSENVDDVKSNYGAKKFQHRASLRASVKQAKFATKAHGDARKSAIIGGVVAAPLLGAAVLTRPKERKEAMQKDAFGISKADKPFKETNPNFRSKGEQKAYLVSPGGAAQAVGLTASTGGAIAGIKHISATGKVNPKAVAVQGAGTAAAIGGIVASNKSANKWRKKKGLEPRDGWSGKPKEKVMKDAFGVERTEVSKAGAYGARALKTLNQVNKPSLIGGGPTKGVVANRVANDTAVDLQRGAAWGKAREGYTKGVKNKAKNAASPGRRKMLAAKNRVYNRTTKNPYPEFN